MQLALNRWFAGTSRRKQARRAGRAAWTVTRLEDRTVPANVGWAVGAGALDRPPELNPLGTPFQGHTPVVNVYDKAGSLLVSFNAYDPLFLGGVHVAVADTNGDGQNDEVITGPGYGGGPDVRVFDVDALISDAGGVGRFVANPRVLFAIPAYTPGFTGGVFVAGGDINGDGRDDIITGPGFGGGPHVKSFSGADGGQTTLLSFSAYDDGFLGGTRVGASDFGGDNGQNPDGTFRPGGAAGSRTAGDAEIITGPGVGGGAHIKLWDYDNQLNAPDNFANLDPNNVFPGFFGGVYVGGGFFTNNRDEEQFVYSDIIVSADIGGGPHVKMFRLDAFIDPARRDVAVYVPANQAVSGDPAVVDGNYKGFSFFPYDSNVRGGVRIGTVVDLNGDGRDEFIAGAGPSGGPDVRVISGTFTDTNGNGIFDVADASLFRFNAFEAEDRNGVFVG